MPQCCAGDRCQRPELSLEIDSRQCVDCLQVCHDSCTIMDRDVPVCPDCFDKRKSATTTQAVELQNEVFHPALQEVLPEAAAQLPQLAPVPQPPVAQKKPAAAAAPKRGSIPGVRSKFIVDGIDITKCPKAWKGIASAPEGNKRSIWWKPFHVVREDGKDCALCNLCCKVLSRGNSSSTSSMKKHISHCHKSIYPILLEMEGQATAVPSSGPPPLKLPKKSNSQRSPQVKVSFRPDDRKMPAKKGGSSKKSAPRPRLMIGMVGNVDITKCPEAYKDRAIAPNKRSIWWNAFHQIREHDKDSALCNLCAKVLSMGNSSSTSCMKRHMAHCHPDIYPVLLELENKNATLAAVSSSASLKVKTEAASATVGGSKKRDRDSTSAARSNNSQEESSKKRQKLAETKAIVGKQFLNQLSLYAAFVNRPFSDYEQGQFRQVIEAAIQHGRIASLGDFVHPSADSVKQNLQEMAADAKKKLKTRLVGKKLTATTDHWISRARYNYVSLTVHWIENFRVYSAVLAVYMFKGSAVVDQLLEDFDAKLVEWGISKSVSYVVTDTEEKMNKFGDMVYEQLGIEQINCLDYSLQLVADIALDTVLGTDDKAVEECCDELSDYDDEDMEDDGDEGKDAGTAQENDKKPKASEKNAMLQKCRAIVGYFSRSTESTKHLHKLQDDSMNDDKLFESKGPLDLIQDVVPRWWSTLSMVDRLLILKGPLGLFESTYGFEQRCRGKKKGKKQVPIGMLSTQEWGSIETLHKLLKPLEAAQNILKGSEYVTSSLVLYVVHVVHGELVALSELSGEENETITTVASKMLESFEQQFASDLGQPFKSKIEREPTGEKQEAGLNKVFVFAHALDPRFKSLAALTTKEDQSAVWEALHKEMVALGPPKPNNRKVVVDDAQSDAAAKNGEEDPDEKSSWALGSKFDAYAAQAAEPSKTEPDPADEDKWKLQCKTEILAYEREPGLGLTKKNENPLVWWRENVLSYPTLWRLAEIYLAVPATAAKSERAFSVDANLVTMRRCQSKTDTTEDSHFLHENAWIVDEE